MKLIILVALLAISISSHASRESHGGGAIVCQDGVFLYDLYEATLPEEHSWGGLNIVRTEETEEAQINKALERLGAWTSPSLRQLVEAAYIKARKIVRRPPPGSMIDRPRDVENEFMRIGCELKGVASYNDGKNRLSIDPDLYKRMPPTDRAALWIHESIYKIWRDHMGAEDSTFIRKMVGHLFSDLAVTKLPNDWFRSNLRLRADGETVTLELAGAISERIFIRVKGETCGPFSMAEPLADVEHGSLKDRTQKTSFSLEIDKIVPIDVKTFPGHLSIMGIVNPYLCKDFSLEIYDQNLQLISKKPVRKFEAAHIIWAYF